jgi:hypothetical protein
MYQLRKKKDLTDSVAIYGRELFRPPMYLEQDLLLYVVMQIADIGSRVCCCVFCCSYQRSGAVSLQVFMCVVIQISGAVS